jgi:hypothetical protein
LPFSRLLSGLAFAVCWAAAARGRNRGHGSAPFVVLRLYGGLVAGAIRAFFDSEWWLLGNGLPFWTLAGLVAGGAMLSSGADAGGAAPAAVTPAKPPLCRRGWRRWAGSAARWR